MDSPNVGVRLPLSTKWSIQVLTAQSNAHPVKRGPWSQWAHNATQADPARRRYPDDSGCLATQIRAWNVNKGEKLACRTPLATNTRAFDNDFTVQGVSVQEQRNGR
jgi:hypothetical protein